MQPRFAALSTSRPRLQFGLRAIPLGSTLELGSATARFNASAPCAGFKLQASRAHFGSYELRQINIVISLALRSHASSHLTRLISLISSAWTLRPRALRAGFPKNRIKRGYCAILYEAFNDRPSRWSQFLVALSMTKSRNWL
jgi:hypothetical protein